jgi:hypothetical protein
MALSATPKGSEVGIPEPRRASAEAAELASRQLVVADLADLELFAAAWRA